MEGAAIWLGYWVVYVMTGTLSMYCMAPKGLGDLWDIALLGACIGTVHLMHVLFWSRDICKFPVVQRHRYFRIKQKIPDILNHALMLSLIALVLFGVANAPLSRPPSSWIPLMHALGPVLLCVASWIADTIVLEVIFTERLYIGDYGDVDVLRAQQKWLNVSENAPLTHRSPGKDRCVLALHDFCLMASDAGGSAWRRTSVFSDDSGSQWMLMATSCMSILRNITKQARGSFGTSGKDPSRDARQRDGSWRNDGSSRISQDGEGGHGSNADAPTVTKWNALPSGIIRSAPTRGHRGLLLNSIASVSADCHCGRLAARALADFAVASFKEDNFGVLQLGEPSLGSVLLCLLETYSSLRYLCRHAEGCAAEIGPWRGTSDVPYGVGDSVSALNAFLDELHVGICSMGTTFGQALEGSLGKTTDTAGRWNDAKQLFQQLQGG